MGPHKWQEFWICWKGKSYMSSVKRHYYQVIKSSLFSSAFVFKKNLKGSSSTFPLNSENYLSLNLDFMFPKSRASSRTSAAIQPQIKIHLDDLEFFEKWHCDILVNFRLSDVFFNCKRLDSLRLMGGWRALAPLPPSLLLQKKLV